MFDTFTKNAHGIAQRPTLIPLYILPYIFKKTTPCNISNMYFMGIFHERHEIDYMITVTNCSSYFSSIVLVNVSGYTRGIFCYVSTGDSSEIKPVFTKYGTKHTG